MTHYRTVEYKQAHWTAVEVSNQRPNFQIDKSIIFKQNPWCKKMKCYTIAQLGS